MCIYICICMYVISHVPVVVIAQVVELILFPLHYPLKHQIQTAAAAAAAAAADHCRVLITIITLYYPVTILVRTMHQDDFCSMNQVSVVVAAAVVAAAVVVAAAAAVTA